jgi:hypothetical protein
MICLLTPDVSIINNSNCRTTVKSQTLNMFKPLTTEYKNVQYEVRMGRKLT